MKTVSIFIRAKNEAKMIEKTLLEIGKQKVKPLEVVVLDNDSQDETAAIAARCGAKVEICSDSDFTYGAALNKSLELTTGEILVFLSAHSPPCHEGWLEELINPIESGEAEASFGRQIPLKGKNVFEEWFVYLDFPKEVGVLRKFLGLKGSPFSNGNAAIERGTLKKYPFREDLDFAEDIEWFERVTKEGVSVRYCNSATVYHSHIYQPGDLRKRMASAGRSMKKQRKGKLYENSLLCFFLHLGTMTVDFLYCLFNGYWDEMSKIGSYRKEYFEGIQEGLKSR